MACCPPNCSPCCAGPPSVPFCPPPCSPCYAGPNFMPPCAPCWTGASQATWMPTCYPINASCFCCPPAPPPKPKCGPNGPRVSTFLFQLKMWDSNLVIKYFEV